MTRYVTALLLVLTVALCLAPAAGANDTLAQHWPRYTTGPAEITVVPSTDPGLTLDPGFAQWLALAVSNWNQSTKVHLTLVAPRPCINILGQICVIGVNYPTNGFWGWTNVTPFTGSLINYAQISINQAHVTPASSEFDQAMIFCHELGEALGLPDPSDSPVTPTVEPTCLTRDWSRIQSFPSAWNYAQLDVLYAAVDSLPPPPPVCPRKKCKR